MQDPVFEIAVEQAMRVDLRVHLPAVGTEGSEQSEALGTAMLAWFGNEFLTHPRLDDLLRLSIYRIGQGPGPIFDSDREAVSPMRKPDYLLMMPPQAAQEDSSTDPLDLFLQPTVGQPGPLHSMSDAARIVWAIGEIAPGALPNLHRQWEASRTVVDTSGDEAMLLGVCAALVESLSNGLENGVHGWVVSPAVSGLLPNVAYAVS